MCEEYCRLKLSQLDAIDQATLSTETRASRDTGLMECERALLFRAKAVTSALKKLCITY